MWNLSQLILHCSLYKLAEKYFLKKTEVKLVYNTVAIRLLRHSKCFILSDVDYTVMLCHGPL